MLTRMAPENINDHGRQVHPWFFPSYKILFSLYWQKLLITHLIFSLIAIHYFDQPTLGDRFHFLAAAI